MEVTDLIGLAIIGLFAGVTGGMLGVGGSIVMIPAMTEVFGPNQHLYQAAAMIVNFFVVVPAVYQHRRAKAITGTTVARIVPLAIVGVVAGVGLSELPLFAGEGEVYLRGLFGLFLLGVALTDLYRLFHKRQARSNGSSDPLSITPQDQRTGWRFAGAVAIPTGLVAGLLGVGGGVMAVPLQRRLLGIPIRTAIANSATIIIATSSIGAIAKNYAYVTEHDHSLESFVLAAVLIPTAIVGSLAGSRLTHRAPLRFVKIAFFLLLLLAATRLTYKAARSAWHPATVSASITCPLSAYEPSWTHVALGGWS
ncbi:MAG: sulfite exporter TauE/SafE family protein [Phycisphaerales bacterium]|nr:MAG: sulfite exporter TauE/SafE family protein [Phycisphaerales bacterium]